MDTSEPRTEAKTRPMLAQATAAGRPGAALMLARLDDRDMRRQIILREINQGALSGFPSEITEHAASLIIDALDAYDATREADHWQNHPWECVPTSLLRQAVESRRRWQARCQEALDLRTY